MPSEELKIFLEDLKNELNLCVQQNQPMSADRAAYFEKTLRGTALSVLMPFIKDLVNPKNIQPFVLFVTTFKKLSSDLAYEGNPIEFYIVYGGPEAVKHACEVPGFVVQNTPNSQGITAWDCVVNWHKEETMKDPQQRALFMEGTIAFLTAGGRPTAMPAESRLEGGQKKFLKQARIGMESNCASANKFLDQFSSALRDTLKIGPQGELDRQASLQAAGFSRAGAVGTFYNIVLPPLVRQIVDNVALFGADHLNNWLPLEFLGVIGWPSSTVRAKLETRPSPKGNSRMVGVVLPAPAQLKSL